MTKQPNLQIIVADNFEYDEVEIHLHRFDGVESQEIVLSRGEDARGALENSLEQLNKVIIQIKNLTTDMLPDENFRLPTVEQTWRNPPQHKVTT